MQREYPILEFDPTVQAVIEPQYIVQAIDAPEHCIVCFFQDVINKLNHDGKTKVIAQLKSEMGTHPVHELEVDGKRLALLHPGVGAPLAAALLEEVISLGCSKFIACGGAGVLDNRFDVGQIIVPSSAIRDEGTSYHYLPPSREVEASPEGIAAIEAVLQRHHRDYVLAKTWTTDGVYRETPAKVQLRKSEGCLTVEMEAAAFFAVARFRDVTFAQVLYAGDQVNIDKWDPRHWHERTSLREELFWLAAEACLSL